MKTDDLTCVATRIKELRKEVGVAEWEGRKDLQFLARELNYYERLANNGVMYDPNF